MNEKIIQHRNVKILGMGRYLPKRKVTGSELDKKIGVADGTTERMSGVKERYYADHETETNSKMGAYAAMAALENAHLRFEDIDAIIGASGTIEQSIPCTAALIQKALGKEKSGIPCFDISSTCLSFVTALDTVSYLIAAGKYKNVLIVSSETASVGLNWNHTESCALFGDGAVAAVVGATPKNESSKIIGSHFMTYSSGSEVCQIQGGGTKYHPRDFNGKEHEEKYLFQMDGKKVFKLTSEILPMFMKGLLENTNCTLEDIKVLVPHQASMSAMELLRRKLNLDKSKWVCIIENYGNMIAASIPMALMLAIEDGRIQRGDRIMLSGTSAGLSIGGLVLDY